MKDDYDLSTMQRVPHPLAGKVKLISRLGSLSEDEFKQRLQNMEPDERDIAIKIRERRRLNTNISTDNASKLHLLEPLEHEEQTESRFLFERYDRKPL